MGVIRKKTISRGTEGGLKYICDVCSADITSTVSSPFAKTLALMGSSHVKLTDYERSAYDAMSALTMTCVYPALEMPASLVITTLLHTISWS